jgi:hypothetical protein
MFLLVTTLGRKSVYILYTVRVRYQVDLLRTKLELYADLCQRLYRN